MAEARGSPVVIVGAGIAGLACGRALREGGRRVLLLERAHGVGGRCATRRIDGQPVDFGVAFLHGRDPAFLAALEAVPATPLAGWPASIRGTGRPCNPEAFAPGERRLAFAEGVAAFPNHLARGLELRLQRRVVAIEPDDGTVRLVLEDASRLEAETAVLALAAEQAAELLASVAPAPPQVESARALLAMARSEACLALLAAYGPGTPAPAWDACFPEESRILQLASHDSAKRPSPAFVAVVYQAHAGWSRQHLEDPDWPAVLLEEAGRLLGPWAAAPRHVESHRWRHARSDRAAELAAPMLLALPGGARLGLCGDRFARGGGVEAAWASGRALAGRILAEEARR
jgi:predicted NAD/FAD-dependent oxidoreductase